MAIHVVYKRKSDIDLRDGNPAVNVKVHRRMANVKFPLELSSSCPTGHPELLQADYTDEGFTPDWIEQNVSQDDLESFFQFACEEGWEPLQGCAVDLFGKGVKVYSEGRSGGWAVIHGLPAVESWNAIMLGKWRRFAAFAHALADDVPRMMVEIVYFNHYETDARNFQGVLDLNQEGEG